MSSKDDFEARLKRIQQTRGGVSIPAPQTGDHADWQMPTRAGRKGGFPFSIVAAGVVSLGLTGFVALHFVAKLGLTVPFAASGEVGANLAGTLSQAVQAGWLDRLFGTGLAANADGDPLSFLPAAPPGWLRMTTADAQKPDAIAQLSISWPTANDPIDSHPGHGDLLEFVRIYDNPDMEQQALSDTRTRAIYLGPDGQTLSLRLLFRSGDDALGSAGDADSWAAALRPEVETAAQLGDTVEAFDLDGMTVFNRAAQGQVGAAQRGGITALDLSVALHSRAVVEILGTAKPGAAIALLQGFDRAALADRLSGE